MENLDIRNDEANDESRSGPYNVDLIEVNR